MNRKELLEDISEVTLTYVVDEGGSIYNKDGGTMVAVCKIIAQNDHIELTIDESSEEHAILSADDLRGLAKKLNEWADLSDETMKLYEKNIKI